jgi:hypothetical protein
MTCILLFDHVSPIENDRVFPEDIEIISQLIESENLLDLCPDPSSLGPIEHVVLQ